MNMLVAYETQTRQFTARLPVLQQVRHFVGDFMAGHPSADDAVLAVSELAANAIEHSGSAGSGGFTVELAHLEGAVRIDVHDAGGSEKPKLRHVDVEATRGRGLFIVDEISRRWGVAEESTHTSVWCEVECAHMSAVRESIAA